MLLTALIATTLTGLAAAPPASAGTDAVLTLDREPNDGYEGPGDTVRLSLYEGDLPAFAQLTSARLRTTSDPIGISVTLRRPHRFDSYFFGRAGFTLGPSDDRSDRVHVEAGDEVTVTYLDVASAAGGPSTRSDSAPWVSRTRRVDFREVDYGNPGGAPEVYGGRFAAVPGAQVLVRPVAGGTPLGSATAGPDGSFSVRFSASPAPESVAVEAQEPGTAMSTSMTVERSLVLGTLAAPEPGNPAMESASVNFTPLTAPTGCSSFCNGISLLTNKSGRFDIAARYLPGGGRYRVTTTLQGQAEFGQGRDVRFYSGAYGNMVPFEADVPTSASSPTVVLPTIQVQGPTLTGASRDALGWAVPDIELWASDDRGEELSYFHARTFGNDAGAYGVFMKDGNWHFEPRSPRGCLPLVTDPFDVVVQNGVASPAVKNLAWRPVGILNTGSVTVGVPPGPGQIDLGTPAGHVTVTPASSSGSGTITAACVPSDFGPGVTVVDQPIDLKVSGTTVEQAEVCLPYTEAHVAAAGLDERSLRLLHRLDDGRVEVLPGAVNPLADVVCGTTASFSPFAVGVVHDTGGGTPTTTTPTTTTPTTTTPTTTTPTTTTPTTTTPVVAPPPAAAARSGYWMVGAGGATYAFGDAQSHGDAPVGAAPAVDLEATASGRGYWVVDGVGHVFSFGDATYHGGAPTLPAGETVTSMSSTPDGSGYWLFTTAGRAVPRGRAAFLGDMSGTRLNGPVLDSIPTPSGRGYYMVASDGGIFAFGDARFAGSMGGARLNAPVQSLVPDPDGSGYWLVASDGGIFAFAADFFGSMGSIRLHRPVTGMVGFRRGYLMVAEDGGIFAFGDARFHGSLGASPPSRPITGVAALR